MCVSERAIQSTDLGHVFAGFPCVRAFIFLLWQLAARARLPQPVARRDVDLIKEYCAATLPPPRQTRSAHSFKLCMCFHSNLGRKKQSASQALGAEFQNFTRQGLDHSPCTTFCPRTPPPLLMFLLYPSKPPFMGLLINSWSCDGCVHRSDVF